MGGTRIVRICRQANRCPDIQVQSFFAAKAARAEALLQSLGDHQRGIFTGLRQQHHEFVPTVAKRKVNQPELRFDQISNLREQLAPIRCPCVSFTCFKMVQINEQHAELISEAGRPVHFRIQRLIQMPRIVEPGVSRR